MALIPTPLPSSGPQVTALQNALFALGFSIPTTELGSPPGNGVFGPVTQAAVRTFRQNLGLPPLAPTEPLFDATAARLLNVVVPANLTTSASLSAAVRESLAAAHDATAIEVEWLARYATIARDFMTARQAAALAPTDEVITTLSTASAMTGGRLERYGLGQGVAAVHTGDGGRVDRARVVAQRSASSTGCRRGHSHRPSKSRHGLMSVVLGSSVCSDAGQETGTGS